MESSKVDAIDNVLLGAVVQNGRATFTELGKKAGLSPHAVAERVRRLVETGVIRGFTAQLDLASIGLGLDALIDVRLLATTTPEHFERRVAELDTVRELDFVTGRFDYQLRIACQDADDLDRTVRALRQEAGAAVTETRIVLRRSTYGLSVPPSP